MRAQPTGNTNRASVDRAGYIADAGRIGALVESCVP
jgi:hypothetical protein